MNFSSNTRQAYSEVHEFLELLSEEQRQKIPIAHRVLFDNERDKEYVKNIDISIPLKEQELKEETLAILALLYLQYWCEDEEEKEQLKAIYAKNEVVYQSMLSQKYKSKDIFNKKEDHSIENNNEIQISDSEQTIFKRIINRIIKLFHEK